MVSRRIDEVTQAPGAEISRELEVGILSLLIAQALITTSDLVEKRATIDQAKANREAYPKRTLQ